MTLKAKNLGTSLLDVLYSLNVISPEDSGTVLLLQLQDHVFTVPQTHKEGREFNTSDKRP